MEMGGGGSQEGNWTWSSSWGSAPWSGACPAPSSRTRGRDGVLGALGGHHRVHDDGAHLPSGATCWASRFFSIIYGLIRSALLLGVPLTLFSASISAERILLGATIILLAGSIELPRLRHHGSGVPIAFSLSAVRN